MKKPAAIALLLLMALCSSCSSRGELAIGAGSKAEAQGQLAGGGLYRVTTIDGGLCSGRGTSSSPLDCALFTDGTSIAGTGSAGAPLSTSAAIEQFAFGMFGDGSDGDIHMDGSGVVMTAQSIAPGACTGGYTTTCYVLIRDTMFDDLTIDDGYVLNPGGFRMWVRGTLTLNGKIVRNANDGAPGVDGSSSVGADINVCAGTASGGSGTNDTGVLEGSNTGGSSAASATTVPSNTSAVSTTGCTTNTTLQRGAASSGGGNGNNGLSPPSGTCRGGGGGSGGGGGGLNSSNAGDAGNVTTQGANHGNIRMLMAATSARTETGQVWTIGTGGGAGSCGRDNTTELNPGGGAGGGVGGWIVVMAKTIVQGVNGGIEAKGGDGGDGGDCGTHTLASGGGVAGAGGGGGVVVLIYNSGNPTIDVSGGAGGTGGTPCAAGGGTGGNGGNGGSGITIVHELSP